jgi:hypothetical protein
MNIWPCIRGSGGRVIFLAEDYTKLIVRLKLNWRTRNIVGTIYGGSMYSSTDPYYMLMFIKILGKDYVVWDKGCTIRFLRPAKVTIFAEFNVTPEMIAEVKAKVAAKKEADFTWRVEYKDKNGVVYAEFDKVVYIADKIFYQEKNKNRS